MNPLHRFWWSKYVYSCGMSSDSSILDKLSFPRKQLQTTLEKLLELDL